jgi:hypothetical protein
VISIAQKRPRLSFRIAFWLAMSVLVTQLLAMQFHHHDLSETDSGCVSCTIGAMPPAPPSSAAPKIALLLQLVYRLADEPVLLGPPDRRSYLSPCAQAPPRRLFPI